MTEALAQNKLAPTKLPPRFPDHTQLPESDGSFVFTKQRGHYLVPLMEVEVGVWEGTYQNQTQLWLRWWDVQGNLLLTGSERAIAAEQRAESAEEKATKLAERLRELGIDPDLV